MNKITEIEISKIKPYPNNPRKNDDAVEYVANSIKEFGFQVPILVNKEYVVIAGHTRLKAAKLLQIKTVPCVVLQNLTPDQEKALRLADNKVGELSSRQNLIWKHFQKRHLSISALIVGLSSMKNKEYIWNLNCKKV